jgi:hypothetical protein
MEILRKYQEKNRHRIAELDVSDQNNEDENPTEESDDSNNEDQNPNNEQPDSNISPPPLSFFIQKK